MTCCGSSWGNCTFIRQLCYFNAIYSLLKVFMKNIREIIFLSKFNEISFINIICGFNNETKLKQDLIKIILWNKILEWRIYNDYLSKRNKSTFIPSVLKYIVFINVFYFCSIYKNRYQVKNFLMKWDTDTHFPFDRNLYYHHHHHFHHPLRRNLWPNFWLLLLLCYFLCSWFYLWQIFVENAFRFQASSSSS